MGGSLRLLTLQGLWPIDGSLIPSNYSEVSRSQMAISFLSTARPSTDGDLLRLQGLSRLELRAMQERIALSLSGSPLEGFEAA